MTRSRILGRALPVAACIALLAASGAPAAQGGRSNDLPVVSDGRLADDLIMGRAAKAFGAAEQNSGENYLPSTQSNVDLVSRLELRHPNGAVTANEIADVGVLKQTAYLAGWSQGKTNEPCDRGGVYSVDISNPAQPRQLAFRPALEQNYHGEGVHAIPVKTSAFQGDLLAVNNETCTALTTPTNQNVPAGGGFDLYDVSNPANPQLLSRANGDYGPEGTLVGAERLAKEAHSVFLWQDGDKAYAVIVDNVEFHDVDIFDVSNPRSVQPVGEFDLAEEFPQIVQNPNGQGNFQGNFLHDMIVKKIGGTQTMLASYWDSGYVTLDVDDPANPSYIADTDFPASDPLTGFSPPEANGHQAEFSHDNRHILAADEDFDQHRFQAEITAGPNDGFTFQEAGGATAGGQVTPGNPASGDTRFVGEGCVAGGPLPAATAGVNIAVFERGTCSFQEKVQQADDAGYDTALIFNNRGTVAPRCDALLSMDLASYTGDVVALFVARSVGFRIIDAYDPATYACNGTAGTGTAAPAPKEGSPVDIAVLFDGWGYAHQYRNGTGKLAKVDDFAITEGVDDRWATRFGDLTIHEFAADPETNLAYISYYSGGLRVVRFGDSGMEEVGRFVDQRPDGKGNDFWGVEQFTTPQGERLIAASDRDFGLYLFRYTGPGAPKPPSPPAPASPAAAPLRETGCANQIAGTAGRDLIAGTDGSDSVRAAAGDDVIDARSGGDCLFGDDGKDVIDGEEGNDRLEGGTGEDRLLGGTGNDVLVGGGGVDRLNGNAGNDSLGGGSKRDTLSGGAGVDALVGGSGKDTLTGGPGRDRISGGSADDRIYGNAGADRITPGRGRDRVIAAGGNDRISARDGRRDRISCGSGRDTVTADRNDVLTSCERVTRR